MLKSNKDQPENMPSSIFPDMLRSELRRNGMKQQELAARVGCTQSDISRWLKGRIPSGDKLVALAQALQCSAEYLITGKREEPAAIMVRDDPIDWRQRALSAEKKLASIQGIVNTK